MSYAPHHPGAESLKKPFMWSIVFHGLLFGSLVVSTIYSHRGDTWGSAGGGGAVSVGLVGKAPRNHAAPPRSRNHEPACGHHQGPLQVRAAEPKPKEIEPDVKKIPEFTKEKAPHYITRPSKVFEDKTPPPPNAVPYGQGGSPALPYSTFAMNSGPTQGGMGFSGPGGGDFAGQIPFLRGRRAEPDQQQLVAVHGGPGVRWAPRASFTFQVLRDGTVTNVQMMQSSGNRSVDNSALRAILSSSPVSALRRIIRVTA